MRYWDASALVPLFLAEATTEAMRTLLRDDQDVHSWWGSRVECISSITRLVREERLNPRMEERARAAQAALFVGMREIEPTEDVRLRAERCLSLHPLRAADALQLAAALIWARDRPAGTAFVSLDGRLRLAASREGFTVLPTAPNASSLATG